MCDVPGTLGPQARRRRCRHRTRHHPHLYAGEVDDEESPPWRVLYLGPGRADNLLDVVVIERDDGTELVIHAMRLNPKYQPLLPRPGRQGDE